MFDWLNEDFVREVLSKYGSPVYIYDEATIRSRIRSLKKAVPYEPFQILYAVKANSNPEIVKIIASEGVGIDAVSTEEIELALRCGVNPSDVLYTGIGVSDYEMEKARSMGVVLNLGSLSAVKRYARNHPNTPISVRINPDVGAGHHGHVITGGPESKFGIYESHLAELDEVVKSSGLKVIGVHSHIGSGILDYRIFLEAVNIILSVAERYISTLEFVDFGGGIGVPYRPIDEPFDVETFGMEFSSRMERLSHKAGRRIKVYLEPGRYIVAESGVLIVEVVEVKETPLYRFAVVNSGFNHLIRPFAYGSYHHILNLSNPNGEPEMVVVAGYLCESGDLFTRTENGPQPRKLPKVREGDLLAIMTAGAYGYSMSSNYNLRPKPAEVLVDETGSLKLIRERKLYD